MGHCPGDSCGSSTVCRVNHACILRRGGRRTVATCGTLRGTRPRDRLSHGTTLRVNVLCTGLNGASRTVGSCGCIVGGCPADRRAHITLRDVRSLCISRGHISRCLRCHRSVTNAAVSSITGKRRSSLSFVTTRRMCTHNRCRRTVPDLAGCVGHCYRALARGYVATRCCLTRSRCLSNGGRDTLRCCSGLSALSNGVRLRPSLLHTSRVSCSGRSCASTLGCFARLHTMTDGPRGHTDTRLNVLHYDFCAKRRRDNVSVTDRVVGSTGSRPRVISRTGCGHTGTCVTLHHRRRTGPSLVSLDTSTSRTGNTRTGCLLTRGCFSTKGLSRTRGVVVGFSKRNAPRRC